MTGRVERWPQFSPLALQAGFRSVHAVPMRLGERVIGALNLFRIQPGRLAESDRRSAQALADVATVGILQVLAAGETAALDRKLEDALASRDVIEQAKGMLAESAGLDMDEAFSALRDLARQEGIALTAVARSMVDGSRELVPSRARRCRCNGGDDRLTICWPAGPGTDGSRAAFPDSDRRKRRRPVILVFVTNVKSP